MQRNLLFYSLKTLPIHFLLAIAFSLISPATTYSQVIDTTFTSIIDTSNTKYTQAHSPKKAALLSAILPGLGQIYNKKYWKLPIIYTGVGLLSYTYIVNQSSYIKYRDAYAIRIDPGNTDTDDYVGELSDEGLYNEQKKYNKRRDLSLIGIGIFYVFNIIDANVDAHLFTFDVSDNLSLNISPSLINHTFTSQINTGIACKIKF